MYMIVISYLVNDLYNGVKCVAAEPHVYLKYGRYLSAKYRYNEKLEEMRAERVVDSVTLETFTFDQGRWTHFYEGLWKPKTIPERFDLTDE